MTYKGVLVEDLPNLAWIFGYTNAPWTLKSDIAGEYLCRLFKHMDDNGHAVATPRDAEDSALDMGMLDQLQSGYVQRAKDTLPRQGSEDAVEGADALRPGLQDAARGPGRRRPAAVRGAASSSRPWHEHRADDITFTSNGVTCAAWRLPGAGDAFADRARAGPAS